MAMLGRELGKNIVIKIVIIILCYSVDEGREECWT